MKGLRLLIVDDERSMIELLSMLIQPACQLIDSAQDLQTALNLSDQNRYHLVLLDLRLVPTGKEESLKAIRKFKRNSAAVVVVSGVMEPHIKEEALAAGADQFVAKAADSFSQALLLACTVAVMHHADDSISEQVEILRNLAHA